MEPLNVLVVDDSLIAVKKLTSLLEGLGHKVVKSVASGAEALAAYRETNPDIVTMDVTMPDMDGIKATSLMMEKFPDASIVMVTSHGQEQMILDALDAGARGYVLKPVRPEKLEETLVAALRRPDEEADESAPFIGVS